MKVQHGKGEEQPGRTVAKETFPITVWHERGFDTWMDGGYDEGAACECLLRYI